MPEFGTSGLRGRAEEMNDTLVAAYAAACCGMFPGDGSLMLGRDLRPSSPRIARAVAQGAAAAGLRVVDCGVLPTPALAMAALARGTIAIMVTGSHIPADRNGLKFYRREGEITKDDEAALTAAVAGAGAFRQVSPTIEPGRASGAYAARYVDFFGERALAGQRIGLWEQSSAARDILPDILAGLGADVVRLGRSDSFVPVDTEAVSETVRSQLAGWVAGHGLDALVSTDGDGDRPLLVDALGVMVEGDVLGPLTARALEADVVVTPVSSNSLVDLMGRFEVRRTKIGSPFVIDAMRAAADGRSARVIGYEPNGGVLLGFEARRGDRRLPPLLTRDSALPLLAVLDLARREACGVADLVATLPARFVARDRLADVPREVATAITGAIIAGDRSALPTGLGEVAKLETLEGARLHFESGVIVTVRPSGNAPELRAYVEADDRATVAAVLAELLARLRDAAGLA